jgi:hypothetical protein
MLQLLFVIEVDIHYQWLNDDDLHQVLILLEDVEYLQEHHQLIFEPIWKNKYERQSTKT